MNICTQCGTQLPEGVKSCPICNTPVSQPTQQEAPAFSPSEQPQDVSSYDYVVPAEDYNFDASAYDIPQPKKSKKGLLFGLIGGGVGLIALIVILCLCFCGGTDFGASKDTVKSDLESQDFMCENTDILLDYSYLAFFGPVEDLSDEPIRVKTYFNPEDALYNVNLEIYERVSDVQPFIEDELGVTFTRYNRYGYEDNSDDSRYVWLAEDDTVKCVITFSKSNNVKTTVVAIYDTEYITDKDILEEFNEYFDAFKEERQPDYD